MRTRGPYEVLRDRLVAGCERFGFRLIEYSVQSNHIHLVAEANNAVALTRGMQGLSVRIARGLNKLWDRTGRLFADRYHSRILRTPTEVKRAVAYVLNNARRHGVPVKKGAADIHSSGPWFMGWRDLAPIRSTSSFALPLAKARSWLLTSGWRLRGLIAVDHVPGARSKLGI